MHTHTNKGLSLFFGIMLILVGLFAINSRIFISEITIYILGWILLIGGGAQCFASFFAGSWSKFFVILITGFISFVIGGIIVVSPDLGTQTLTMLISIVFIIDGLFRIADSVATHAHHWGWNLTGGVLIFLLGVSLWMISPIGNIGIIGLLIGLAFVISGFFTITNAYTHHPSGYRTI